MLSVLSRLSENSSRTHDTLILRLKQTKRKKCRTMTQAKRQGSETCVVGLQKRYRRCVMAAVLGSSNGTKTDISKANMSRYFATV